MKKNKYVFSLIIFFIILISILFYLRDINSPVIVSNFEDFLYKYDDFDEELPVHFTDECDEYKSKTFHISKAQAIEDIDNLFSLLKFGYSGYMYFGGDERFYQAKESILNKINLIESEGISTRLLSTIIGLNLKFIQDSHFAVENHKLCEYTKYFSSKDYSFYKDFKGYYTYIDDSIYYLDKVNDDKP